MAFSVEILGKTAQPPPHKPGGEATSRGAPSNTSTTASKGDVASWWPSRRRPASVMKATLGRDVRELTCFTSEEIEGRFW